MNPFAMAFGVIKGALGGGAPMIGDLIKLDKEAQRDVANGIKALCYATVCIAGLFSLLLFAIIIKLVW